MIILNTRDIMTKHINLEYYLPQIGKITCRLYQPSSTICYKVLDDFNHIKRLKKIDHLGIIRKIYEGAHHTRWEYVMVQLGLLHRLREVTSDENREIPIKLGLSAKAFEFGGYKISGAQILQMWVMLLNSGHLPYTFASERALMKCCIANDELRQIISNNLSKKMDQYFLKCINDEDIYSMHKVLSYFYLSTYKHKMNPNWINLLQKVLESYIFPDKNKLLKMVNIFKRIRQLSYLFLDTQYSPFPLEFDLSKLYINLQDYIPDLFEKDRSQIIRTLDSFEDFLSINMYHSDKTLREFGYITRIIEKRINQSHITNTSDLYEFLYNDMNFEYESYNWRKYPLFHILFDLSQFKNKQDLIIESFKSKWNFANEENLSKKIGDMNPITFHSSQPSNHYSITLSFNQDVFNDNISKIAILVKYLINLSYDIKGDIFEKLEQAMENYTEDLEVNEQRYKDYITDYMRLVDDHIDEIFQEPYQELLITILTYLNNDYSYRFTNNYEKTVIPLRGFDDIEQTKTYIELVQSQINEDDPRNHELETLKSTINQIGSDINPYLLSLSPILVYDLEQEHTDLDGFALGYEDYAIKILVMEAKDMVNGHNIAKTKLTKIFKEKKLFNSNKIPKIKLIDEKISRGAYYQLILPTKHQLIK